MKNNDYYSINGFWNLFAYYSGLDEEPAHNLFSRQDLYHDLSLMLIVSDTNNVILGFPSFSLISTLIVKDAYCCDPLVLKPRVRWSTLVFM